MPDITDEEFKELQTLRSSAVGKDLEIARSTFRADNPHVPISLINAYSGDPAGMEGFGKALLEQFPKPQVQQALPPPVVPVVPPVTTPQVTALVSPVAPASPVMAAQMQPPPSPEAQRLAYAQQVAQGQAIVIPGTVPAPAPVPSPGSADALTAQNSQVADSQKIREKMRIGRATIEEAQWLSQNGEHGFTAAMTRHARRVQAVVGRAQ